VGSRFGVPTSNTSSSPSENRVTSFVLHRLFPAAVIVELSPLWMLMMGPKFVLSVVGNVIVEIYILPLTVLRLPCGRWSVRVLTWTLIRVSRVRV
jgi:hypothetical protein